MEVGFDYRGRFKAFDTPTLLRPLTKTDYTLDIYYGCQYECIKNIKLGSVTLPYRDVWSLHVVEKDNHWIILLDHDPIATFEQKKSLSQEAPDELWLNRHNARMDYIDYINETKSTLYDPQIKYSIEKLVPGYPTYSKLIEKFERAEQLGQFDDLETEEYKLALKEIQFFVDPIMQKIMSVYS